MTTQLLKLETSLHADSVEWCPSDGLENILACGTYQLNEQSGIREGSLHLLKWGTKNDKLSKLLSQESRAGILDMKWKQVEDSCILALATSEGVVQVFQLKCDENLAQVSLEPLLAGATEESKTRLCLSLDWGKPISSNVIVVSDSLGQISVMDLDSTGLRLQRSWRGHGYEAWIVCFGLDNNNIFSGGDDCKLHRWDLRSAADKPVATTKWHEMGVCSLQCHPTNGYILASGSYDENMVLWDVRDLSRPVKSMSLGGGVWRIKWNYTSSLPDLVAAACMHNHFCIVDTGLATSDPMAVVSQYKEHGSLAYGIDWCRKHEEVRSDNGHDVCQFTLASCSFYDNSMHLWRTAIKR